MAELQERLRLAVASGYGPETLLLLEHEPVITLGRHAEAANILANPTELQERGIEVHHSSRGGDVTYHGPGQLVGYPIFRLRRGIRAHVEAIAQSVIEVLADFGIRAEWRVAHPGVWVGTEKICAVGVHVRGRITIHGFALNVSTALDAFSTIVPCGLRGFGVTSMARCAGHAPALLDVARLLAARMERNFSMPLREVPATCSRLQLQTAAR